MTREIPIELVTDKAWDSYCLFPVVDVDQSQPAAEGFAPVELVALRRILERLGTRCQAALFPAPERGVLLLAIAKWVAPGTLHGLVYHAARRGFVRVPSVKLGPGEIVPVLPSDESLIFLLVRDHGAQAIFALPSFRVLCAPLGGRANQAVRLAPLRLTERGEARLRELFYLADHDVIERALCAAADGGSDERT